MTDASLRKRMSTVLPAGDQSVRRYAPASSSLSLRALLSSLRLLHISDLHFSSSRHTLDWRDGHLVIDTQDSPQKSRTIAAFLCAPERGPAFFGTNVVVISGDLTDSGDAADYAVAVAFIETLKRSNFIVHVVPGNHDYCKEGNLIVAQILASITPPLPPGISLSDLPALPDAVLKPIREATKAAIKALFPAADLRELLDYLVDQILAVPPVTDTVDNQTRRRRFISAITHYENYPHTLEYPNGYLILLDSMQGQLGGTDDFLAQGKLGEPQLLRLESKLLALQAARATGKKIAISLHHSPFSRADIETWTNSLGDRLRFLEVIDGRVDAVLFGHVGPAQQSHEQRRSGEPYPDSPLVNSENLEPMGADYPITLLDLGPGMRAVFRAGAASPCVPELTWVNS